MATVTIQPDASTGVDTYIVAGGGPFGSETSALVGQNNIGTIGRALIRFDLTAYLDKVITSATLTLNVSFVLFGGAGLICRVTQTAWNELATWTTYDGSNNWETAGGDFTLKGAVPFRMPSEVGTLTIKSTSDFVALVQDAIDNRNGYLDMMFKSASDAVIPGFAFDTSDHATAALRPKLTLSYKDTFSISSDATPISLSTANASITLDEVHPLEPTPSGRPLAKHQPFDE